MTAAVLLGAAGGLGLFLVVLGARPTRVPLPVLLARLESVPEAVPSVHRPAGNVALHRVGRETLSVLETLGVRQSHLAPDLAVAGKSLEVLCAKRLALGIGGAGLGLVLGQAAGLVGIGLPVALSLVMVAAGAAGGVALPVAALRSEAQQARRDFRFALGAYLDLVAVLLTSGAGVEEALLGASRVGRGLAFSELRQAVEGARRSGETAWAALDRLGRRLGVEELVELSANVTLVGLEGARAKDTLLTKARSLRAHQLSETEAEANRRTEAARVPLALQLFGFVILLVFPPLVRVLTGLG